VTSDAIFFHAEGLLFVMACAAVSAFPDVVHARAVAHLGDGKIAMAFRAFQPFFADMHIVAENDIRRAFYPECDVSSPDLAPGR
jgi:hypothetical protein